MKKSILLDPKAEKELSALPVNIQKEFSAYFHLLKETGRLEYPQAKKIDQNLFEVRIKIKNTYRGLYAYIKRNRIIILHIFQKKTQKTPSKNLKTAHQRLKLYD